jgi:type III restriction enzyme
VAVWTQTAGIAGAGEDIDIERYRHARRKEVAFRIASLLVHRFADDANVPVRQTETTDDEAGHGRDLTPQRAPDRPWLFANLVRLADQWLRDCVTYDADAFVGLLLPAQAAHRAAEKLFGVLVDLMEHDGTEVLLPMFRRFDPEGSTADVDFLTRKVVIPATKSQVSHVVLDGIKGNTWEEGVAGILEHHDLVHGLREERPTSASTDPLRPSRARATTTSPTSWCASSPVTRARIDACSSSRCPAATSRRHPPAGQGRRPPADQWCTAVNNHGGWGRWGYVEIDRRRSPDASTRPSRP